MVDQFPNVFRPLRLGSLTVKHRVYATAHNVGMADASDLPDERAVAYYRTRAKGGAALLFSGGSPVHQSAFSPSGKCWATWHDGFPRALKKVTNAVHEYEVPFVMQIHHHGSYGSSTRHQRPILSCSDSRARRHRKEAVHEMDVEEIQEIVQAYGAAAVRCREGGADGVEILCATNGLIVDFLSPELNLRTDEYGQTEENRLRLFYEVLDSVRKAVGTDYPVGIKVTGDDLEDGALSLEDWMRIAQKVVERGKLDWIGQATGYSPSFLGWTLMIPPHFVPPGYNTYVGIGLKEAVDIPVMLNGRITELSTAEQLLADGCADMIGMTRAHICDPELIKKAREGRTEEIRLCMNCNMACVGRRERGSWVSCVQNPETGRLGVEWAPLEETKTRSPRKVMVVGGGIAGMEAARVAAFRGHDVTLYEKTGVLGGQLNISRRAPRRDELEAFITNKEKEMQRAGVKVKLNTEVTAEGIDAEGPDVVILATGAVPYVPHDIPGVDLPNVVNAWDVLLGKVEVGERVLVLDGDREQQGLNVAEFLSDRGKRVQLLTKSYYPGVYNLDQNTTPHLYAKLYRNGVKFMPNTWVREIGESRAIAYNVYTNEDYAIEVDTVVLALGGRASASLSKYLRQSGREFYLIGDCMAPRNMEYATLEGHQVGRAIE